MYHDDENAVRASNWRAAAAAADADPRILGRHLGAVTAFYERTKRLPNLVELRDELKRSL